MARQMIALCDSNFSYGDRLANYLEGQVAFPYSVMVFSALSELLAYGKKRRYSEDELHYLVLSEDLKTEYERLTAEYDTGVRRLFVMTGKEEKCQSSLEELETGNTVFLYRFQSASRIMHGILSQMETLPSRTTGGCRLIGFFTPVGRCMQTSIALATAQHAAGQRRSLYVNLEGFSGLREVMDKDFRPDLSDLMYYLRRGGKSFMQKLEQFLGSFRNVDMLPPTSNYTDLMSISSEEWLRFLKLLQEDGRFGYVFLDLSEYVKSFPEILRYCDEVVTLYKSDAMAKAKVNEYKRMLSEMHYEDVVHKMREVEAPDMNKDAGKSMVNGQIHSELSLFAAKLAKEELGIQGDVYGPESEN